MDDFAALDAASDSESSADGEEYEHGVGLDHPPRSHARLSEIDGMSEVGSRMSESAPQITNVQMQRLFNEAKEERDHLMSVHVAMSRRLSSMIADRPHTAITDDLEGEGAEARYAEALTSWRNLRADCSRLRAQFDATIEDTKAQLAAAEAKAKQAADGLIALQLETAKIAVNLSTGRHLPERLIHERLKQSGAALAETNQARLRFIRLRSRSDALRQTLNEREQLSEGLHLIDFEKQKADNATLSAKAADRESECARLRAKTAAALQVLAHMKEKIFFTRTEVVTLTQQLEQKTASAGEIKEYLRQLKREREWFTSGADALRAEHGTVTNPVLLDDYEEQMERRAELAHRVEQMKARHAALTGGGGNAYRQSSVSAMGMLPQQAGGMMTPASFDGGASEGPYDGGFH